MSWPIAFLISAFHIFACCSEMGPDLGSDMYRRDGLPKWFGEIVQLEEGDLRGFQPHLFFTGHEASVG
ncbi:hypothetical protein CEQ24_029555 [Burkholderia glumae]|nr:hypothetical protein CEQ24_029555 [Burkholderia glumae]